MKVLQVSVGSVRMPPTEGSAPLQVMFNVSRQLATRGHQVVILDRKYSRTDPAEQRIDGVQIVRLRVPQAGLGKVPGPVRFVLAEFNAILFGLAVSGYLRKNGRRFDVVHLHLISIGLVLIALNRSLRQRMYYTCHLSQWGLEPDSLAFLERLHLRVDAFLMHRVRRVFAVNEAARRSFASLGRITLEKITVLPHGVDADFFCPDSDDAVKARYGLDGKTLVLFVGRLAKIKGVVELLKAADDLINRQAYKDVAFVLVGPGAFPGVDEAMNAEETEAYITQHDLAGRVVFTGSLPLLEVRAMYAACHVFVCPSLAEAGPLVTLEAMASGLPIVGTRVGAMPDQVVEGWNGFLVEPGDPIALARCIGYLVADPDERNRMGRNSRERAKAEFDWKTIAARQELAYSR